MTENLSLACLRTACIRGDSKSEYTQPTKHTLNGAAEARERRRGAEVMRRDDQGFDLGSSQSHACDADEGDEAVDACLV
jgi:hypothetical protein